MSDRKDDIIIGLLVVIIILQVYGLFFGEHAATAMPGTHTTIPAPLHVEVGSPGEPDQTRTVSTP